MFCEGLYLNTIMVYAFGTGKVLITSCYLVGWCKLCVLKLSIILLDFLVTVKAAPHECVIRTGQS